MHPLPLFFVVVFSLSTLSTAEANKPLRGFAIDLIHRHSPLSPFYNSSMTQSELIRDAALRSMFRSNPFHHLSEYESQLAETVIIPNTPLSFNYLMRVFIGTPPVERFAIADTGSDLIWFQCSPCSNCYSQKDPLFDPTQSSTYTDLLCNSNTCALLPHYQCGSSNQCLYYNYLYGDKSYTNGVLAQDSINFGTSGGQSTSFSKSVFGCGSNNGGTFTNTVTGLVGLGNGALSLVSQLGDQIGRKFSYCLLPFFTNTKSKIKFGDEATISRNGVVSTPLINNDGNTYYILNLEGISIGQKTVQTGQSESKIVIDSGTTFTMLPRSFYNNVEALVKEAIGFQPIQNPPNPYNLCYPYNSEASSKNFPFVVHFTGADLSLNHENLFVTPIKELVCFAVFPTDGLSLYGNVAQINFEVEYDVEGKKVSFAPSDCTQQ